MIVVAIFVFFLMLPRPLRSTLFPYTTLFRSCKVAVRQYRGVNVSATGGHLRVQLGIGDIGSRSGESKDRKSTRLNSSHVANSYAVFCLKKKIARPEHRTSEEDERT